MRISDWSSDVCSSDLVRNRLDAARARTDTRAWVVARRTRTKHLIAMGGLVQKAGLVTITHDDHAKLYGAFLALTQRLSRPGDDQAKILLSRRAPYAYPSATQSVSTSLRK